MTQVRCALGNSRSWTRGDRWTDPDLATIFSALISLTNSQARGAKRPQSAHMHLVAVDDFLRVIRQRPTAGADSTYSNVDSHSHSHSVALAQTHVEEALRRSPPRTSRSSRDSFYGRERFYGDGDGAEDDGRDTSPLRQRPGQKQVTYRDEPHGAADWRERAKLHMEMESARMENAALRDHISRLLVSLSVCLL